MKGVYRSVQKTNKSHEKTNFDDWSDVLLRRIKHRTRVKNTLTEYEKKARLNKFKTKTGYCQTDDDIDNIRLKVKQGEPLLHHKEVRKLRLPPFSGLVMNLRDDGYPATAEYIKDLIVFDDMYSQHDPNRSLLRSAKSVLDKLAEGLKMAEDAKKKGNSTGEVQSLINLALDFMNLDSSFSWLIEEFMEQSIGLLENPPSPVDPQVEATLRFTYSSFLLDIAHDLARAKLQLMISMDLSAGKNFWMIDKGDDMLYLKSCVLLSKINLEEAHEKKNTDIERAIDSCRSSLHWAKQANCNPMIANVLLTLAEFYLDSKQLFRVFDTLQEHIKLCKTCLFDRELCEGYVLLAKYHEVVGNYKELVDVIEELISFALDKEILDLVMKAHIKLAEIYGTKQIAKMNYHAAAAFKYCHIVGNKGDIDLAGCFVGVAQGHSILCEYADLVANSDFDGVEIKALLDWKMIRTPFFSGQKMIMYQSEIEDCLLIKSELEKVKAEEINFIHEEKLRKFSSYRSQRVSSTHRFDLMRLNTKRSNVEIGGSRPSMQMDSVSGQISQTTSHRTVSFF